MRQTLCLIIKNVTRLTVEIPGALRPFGFYSLLAP
jgi:hypothetical protein